MIDKLVVHLKNIIFFKIIIYLLFIITLALLIPIFIADLEKAAQRKQKANAFLREATLQIESINDFEEKIIALNNDYNSLLTSTQDLSCSNRTRFIRAVESFTAKYQLFDPISIKISKGFEGGNSLPSNGNIKIDYHTADINFKTLNPYHLLIITQDLCGIMPAGSVVLSSSLRSINVLTPEIIDTLTTAKAPELFDVKVKILLRDIVYEK
ncbi:MAG: hypothetical protein K9G65_01455 [Rickettsiaceae bacterium]|jgi:hypothetical protein|nr:hypothetical protein [Rickettsiaceae bacterium]